jgi:ATP-dependent Lon protease
MESLLPLFPLDVVLFPDMLLPLHIFEERYKEMIIECLQQKSGFGVVYSHDETIEDIGCVAEISKVIRRYPDGRMDILVVGKQRFQVLFFDSEKAYLRGTVETVLDLEAGREPSEEKAVKLVSLYQQAYRLLNRSEPEELNLGGSNIGLVFKIASVLFLGNEIKQEILTTRSEDDRVELLTEHLEEIIPKLRQAEQAVRRAGSNGNLRRE